ncbi:hypothetical protein TURU_005813 [Turdus rufiventris]|nr:hypothetical protein TURU_005813 [Turdus rufiventris]
MSLQFREKALQKSRKMMSLGLPLSTNVVISSQKFTRLVRQDLVKSCQLTECPESPPCQGSNLNSSRGKQTCTILKISNTTLGTLLYVIHGRKEEKRREKEEKRREEKRREEKRREEKRREEKRREEKREKRRLSAKI